MASPASPWGKGSRRRSVIDQSAHHARGPGARAAGSQLVKQSVEAPMSHPEEISTASPTDVSEPRLGSWVRSTRMAQGLSQREFAERAGISQSYVSDIELERGVHPSLGTLDRLAAGLGATRTDVLRAAGYLSAPRSIQADGAELRLVRLYRDLTAPNQATVERFVQFIHAEESRWIQASLIPLGAPDPSSSAEEPDVQQGPTLFDTVS